MFRYTEITFREKNTSTSKKNIEGKGNAIPLQSCRDPEGARRLRIPDFKTIGT
jgi:hypothetical protein